MRAVVYDAPRSFTVRDLPIPDPGPGHVRVRVLQTGVCGTDLHLHEGQFMAMYPMIPGHETVGVVDALGEGVTGVVVGEQVTINPNSSCEVCDYCRAGRPLLCDGLTGMGSNQPGMFAEYADAPLAQVFSVAGIDPDVAVFTEPTACVAHGIDVIRPQANSTAVVFGAGPTGILMAQLIAANGAAHVMIAGSSAFKLETARNLGVDETFLLDRADLTGDVAELRNRSGGAGFDLVVDATGAPAVIEQCIPLTRNGGTAAFYGVTPDEATITVSPYDIFRREITVKGSFAEISSFPSAITALRTGRVRTDGIITHRFGLGDYGQALDALRDDRSVHKIIIDPRL